MERMVFSLFALVVLMMGIPPVHAQTQPLAKGEAKPATMVNLNTASASELETLPGIGASTAARIVEYRQKNGPFKRIEELMNVQGVGEKSFLKLRSMITVAPKGDAGRSQS